MYILELPRLELIVCDAVESPGGIANGQYDFKEKAEYVSKPEGVD